MATFKNDIKDIVAGDVDDSQQTLDTFSRDASLFHIEPSVVVSPKNVADIRNLVSYVKKERAAGKDVSLTARSAGTDMTGGPLTSSIVVSFIKYFNHIKKIGSNFATFEPGVYYRDFEKETLKQHMIMPSYPASRELCTVGGMVANNSGGEKTLRYGKTAQYVEEVKMVLDDAKEHTFRKLSQPELEKKLQSKTREGKVYKQMYDLIRRNYDVLQKAKPEVTKNSSGYALWDAYNPKDGTFDLTKVIVGSQGTLGLITEATFKLVPIAPASRLLVIFLKDTKNLAEITSRVLKHKPETFESYDDNTFRLAIKFFPELLERVKGNIVRIAIGLVPEAWMLLTGGLPKLVLLAEFTGKTVEEAEAQAHLVKNELAQTLKLKMRVTASDEETKEFWVIRRESFSLLRKHIRGLRTAPFIDDFAVASQYLPQFLPKLYAIMRQYKLMYTIAGHVGDGNFHIIPLVDPKDPTLRDVIVKLSKQVYDLVLSFHGTITAEHNDGLIRGPFLEHAFGPKVYGLFEETKKIFDPGNIFNPGKKVNVAMSYVLNHLDLPKK